MKTKELEKLIKKTSNDRVYNKKRTHRKRKRITNNRTSIIIKTNK